MIETKKLAAVDCLATSDHRLCQLFKGTLNPQTVRHPRATGLLIVIIMSICKRTFNNGLDRLKLTLIAYLQHQIDTES